jgi:hypothetical protein
MEGLHRRRAIPAWTTRDLLFLGGDDRIIAVSYDGAELVHSRKAARLVANADPEDGPPAELRYIPGRTRAVVFPRPPQGAEGSLHATLLLNFFDEVRRRIP